MPELPPLSLYIHIPWCVRKCPYCDFNSHTTERIPEQAYIDALQKDLRSEADLAQGRHLQSIFIGGGTPSLFSAKAIQQILTAAQKELVFAQEIEITMEANPGMAEYDNLQGYFQAGVNRLSFGVQSFNDGHLQALGRIHSAKEAYKAFTAARLAGFANINIDLMHGLPNQSQDQAVNDIAQACSLEPEHISWYQLTIEPNTQFYRTPPELPVEDNLWEIQQAGLEFLTKSGFQQYEISAYCRDNKVSSHNKNYWQFGDYLGIGAGAHGKITQVNGAILRRQKTRTPKDYIDAKSPLSKQTEIPFRELPLEFMMNALRLTHGVPKELFEQRTGVPISHIQPVLDSLITKGLLTTSDDLICATELGQNYLNDTLQYFSEH